MTTLAPLPDNAVPGGAKSRRTCMIPFLGFKSYFVEGNNMTFGSRLKSYRKSNYMTQEDLATLCSIVGRASGIVVKAADISHYESGHCFPSNAKAAVICKVIGMRPSTYANYTGKVIKPTKATSKPRTRRYNASGKTTTITIN